MAKVWTKNLVNLQIQDKLWNLISFVGKLMIYNAIVWQRRDVSKNVRLFERKDKGYFHNSKMFNKKMIYTLDFLL